jgi:hypothetical protein
LQELVRIKQCELIQAPNFNLLVLTLKSVPEKQRMKRLRLKQNQKQDIVIDMLKITFLHYISTILRLDVANRELLNVEMLAVFASGFSSETHPM